MPEYLAPGVYIEEIERGPKPIEGVATSTAAFLGETARGPVRPTLVTSYGEYLRRFGSVFADDKYMPHAVKAFFDNGGRRCYIARIVGANAAPATVALNGYTINAVGPGVAGNRIWVQLGPSSTKIGQNPIGFRVDAFYWDDPNAQPFDPIANPKQFPRPAVSETFDDLSTDPARPNFYKKAIGQNASLVTVDVPPNTAPPATAGQALANGTDGNAVTVNEFIGAAAAADDRRGLSALSLDPFREVALVYAPAAPKDVLLEVVGHCERNRFRFAVIDSVPNAGNATALDPRTDLIDTQYAAFYYPWIVTPDARTSRLIKAPPGGFVCGIYARSDNTRGVWKAPANEVVSGAFDLEYDIDHGTQEVLNPRGVNAIRRFPGRGIRVWGARTLSSDPLWKYVSVRRLFIFIEASIYNSTQWVVFEPNDEKLWARVKQTVTLFLRTQWREGALMGTKEEEAFSVAAGRGETMTEDDILNGRLIIEVGIAPVRPAEFVIFRVFQRTQEAKTA